MSQQPPYGPQDPQDPQQQPYQQPYTPYSQGAYPNPYGQMPQQKSNTTRNVLLIVGAVVLLFCGGLVALSVLFINNIDDAFDPEFNGSEDDPLSIEEGEAFSIRGFDYEKGWTVQADDTGSIEILGLRGTNNRDDEDAASVYIYFEFYQDNARLGTVSCTSGSSITFERTAVLRCSGYDADIAGYDELEVYDSSFSY